MRYRLKAGFTLVELLVVIVIIAVVAALLFPAYAKAQEKSRQTSCISNQRQIAMAATIWAQDHGDAYPKAETFWKDINVNKRILLCPTSPKVTPIGYVYSRFIAGKAMGLITEPTEEIITTDGNNTTHYFASPADFDMRHNEGYVASYCDEHVEWLRELPAMWYIDLSSYGEADTQLKRERVPSLAVIYTQKENNNTCEADFSERLVTAMKTLAGKYRLRVQFVFVNGDDYPILLKEFNVIPGHLQQGYPTVILYDKNTEVTRFTGFPADGTMFEDEEWKVFIGECVEKITAALDKECAVTVGGDE